MKMFKKFRQAEEGAVTVDWVVLTAGVVVLGGLAFTGIKSSLSGTSGKLSAGITAAETALK
jgi:hypothetical protein